MGLNEAKPPEALLSHIQNNSNRHKNPHDHNYNSQNQIQDMRTSQIGEFSRKNAESIRRKRTQETSLQRIPTESPNCSRESGPTIRGLLNQNTRVQYQAQRTPPPGQNKEIENGPGQAKRGRPAHPS